MKVFNNQKGSALLITLFIMSMLTIVASMSVDRSISNIEVSFNQLHEEQSFYVAEAGLTKAFFKLNEDSDWRTGYAGEVFGEGTYSVVLRDSSTNPGLDDTVLIQSAGRVDGSNSFLQAWVVPKQNFPFETALFANSNIILNNNTCTDSYRSDSGSYLGTKLGEDGDIGSNGTVTVDNGSTIGGDVSSATDSGITLSVNSTVLGDTSTTIDSVSMEMIPDSDYDFAMANNSAATGMTGVGYTYDTVTGDLFGGLGAEIILGDGIYYFNNISLTQNAKITIAPGASVIIYMDGELNLRNSSTGNLGGLPTDFMIFSRGSTFLLEQSTAFSGAFYGPNAYFSVENNIQMYGAVVANTISVANSACFHYDRTLAEYSTGLTNKLLIVAWHEM
ncbi:MAG: hypothetical protein IIA17_01355 [candidate division Zixibacteria bacterium]|nr:hypothetical protein [candidate division Zixibacteria bacterium]